MSTSTITETIKERLSIYDVVSSYIKLEKSGKNFKAKSPFTNEKTPSFFVVPDKDFFYCFSSGKGGDIFSFVQEMEGVDFKEALKILADKAGVSLSAVDLEKNTENSKLYKALEYATRLYGFAIRKPENKKVLEYLATRGITGETVKEFRIGFAPLSWDFIFKNLSKHGIETEVLEKVGLVKKIESGKIYDRFRDRVMFPIANASGKIVGFSGRILPWGSDKEAKYINSPESPVFNKSELLYGYDRAKKYLSREDKCIVVEGQMDVVMAHQAGTQNTVGISGTGLTEGHLHLIKRFTSNLIFALDADGAGMKALRRSVERAYRDNFSVRIVPIPLGEDPASLILKDKNLWLERVSGAIDYIDFLLGEQASALGLKHEERKNYIFHEVFPVIAWLKSRIEGEKALQKVARFLDVSEESVHADFQSGNYSELIVEPEAGNVVTHANLTPEENFVGLLLWQREENKKGDNNSFYANIEARFNELSPRKFQEFVQGMDDLKKNILLLKMATEYENCSEMRIAEGFEELLVKIEINNLQKANDQILAKMRILEEKDPGAIEELLAENKSISQKLIELKNKLHAYGK